MRFLLIIFVFLPSMAFAQDFGANGTALEVQAFQAQEQMYQAQRVQEMQQQLQQQIQQQQMQYQQQPAPSVRYVPVYGDPNPPPNVMR